jgi:hypothetical protein
MDRESFQVFLDFANEKLNATSASNNRQIVILDNATWHKVISLNWGRLEPVFLPAYSPDFNPIERLWLRLKCDYFQDFIAKDHEALMQQADIALNHFMSAQKQVSSICAVSA